MLCLLRVTIDKKCSIKSIGAYANSNNIASKALFLLFLYKVCFILNGKIDIINSSIFNVASFSAHCKRSR